MATASVQGLDAAYIPGWDCHGLPIENAIEKKFGVKFSAAEVGRLKNVGEFVALIQSKTA